MKTKNRKELIMKRTLILTLGIACASTTIGYTHCYSAKDYYECWQREQEEEERYKRRRDEERKYQEEQERKRSRGY